MGESYEPLPRDISIGDKYGPAMRITEQAAADEYFKRLVAHAMHHNPDIDGAEIGEIKDKAEAMERRNLGYYAGYYDCQTMARVNRLFHTEHPIFGKEGIPTGRESVVFQAANDLAFLAGALETVAGARVAGGECRRIEANLRRLLKGFN